MSERTGGTSSDNANGASHGTKKRKRVVLSIQQKQEVLDRLAEGEKPAVIADEFGISRQQVSDIKKNESRILKYCTATEHTATMKRKTLKASSAPMVEKDLLQWFTAETEAHNMVTNDMLFEKAIELFAQLPAEQSEAPFKASSAWMRNFKRRHGIRRVSTGDGYDGLTLPDEAKLSIQSPDQSGLASASDSSAYLDPALRALSRRVNSLEQVMQENVMHLEARIDEVVALLQQQQNMK